VRAEGLVGRGAAGGWPQPWLRKAHRARRRRGNSGGGENGKRRGGKRQTSWALRRRGSALLSHAPLMASEKEE